MKKCPRCHHEMAEDCYLSDTAQPVSNYIVIEKDENFKKQEHTVKVAMCKECGYLELYAEIDKK